MSYKLLPILAYHHTFVHSGVLPLSILLVVIDVQTFHTNPNILHYRNNEPNGQMAPGHTFTIEPMICEGSAKALTWPDEWTATTVDGRRSAQFEHTLLVTPDGVEALTGKTEDSPVQFWERDSKVHEGIWLGTSAAAKQRMASIKSGQTSSASTSK
jgi:methionyl aminopeptidase